MRLWHKDLIPVLPRHQLLGQWRECCAIAKSIMKTGSPNHILVNKILEYPNEHFYCYSKKIVLELDKRGYKPHWNNFTRYFYMGEDILGYIFVSGDELFEGWHNNRYLIQCYYNLQEKFDCGGISKEEFEKIEDIVKKVI